ncbi:MAG: hypothetical protein MZV64_08195 [Ignavibacteriales bacterium]|nr:hypothetical protein [Ignavibacteriales bacterium]
MVCFVSINNGESWTEINNGLATNYENVLLENSLNQIFLGTSNGIFKSADNGDYWEALGLNGVNIISLLIKSDGTLYAGSTLGSIYMRQQIMERIG